LPLAYSKDMQEDKEPTFEAYKTTKLCIQIANEMVKDIVFNKERMEEAACFGYSTATDLADFLVRKYNIPFRKSHHIVGSVVALATKKNIKLEELSLNELKSIESQIDNDVYSVLSVKNSVASKKSYGGTGFDNVNIAIQEARKILQKNT
jgi:argininosuccinate lyase